MSDFLKRLTLVLIIFPSLFSYSQDSEDTSKADYKTFSLGAGFSDLAMLGDLKSFDTYSGDAYFNIGGYVYVDIMFNSVFGIEVKANRSELGGEIQRLIGSGTREDVFYSILYAENYSEDLLTVVGMSYGVETSLIINLDNLGKDQNKKWSYTSYLGIGYHKYNSRLIIKDYVYDNSILDYWDHPYSINNVEIDGTIKDANYGKNPDRESSKSAGSFYFNMAIGVKYSLTDKIDIEGRAVLNINNEDHLDAAISLRKTYESFFTGNIGVVYNFGKK